MLVVGPPEYFDVSPEEYFAEVDRMERRGRIIGAAIIAVVVVGILLFLFFVGFSAVASATGSCGGG